ncbi:MAG: hypothetical protein IJ165_15600 [Proteobacteria bacterium]|nr:hypothetical protein [Pseudomonadota bacterium]
MRRRIMSDVSVSGIRILKDETMIIAFSGVDCAGKTTQIEFLRQYFISQGKSCTVFWYRPGYSDELQRFKGLVRPLFSRSGLRQVGEDGHESARVSEPRESKARVPAPIWLVAAIMDAIGQYALKLRWLEKRYDVVICDRYVHDACLDLAFKYPGFAWSEAVLQRISVIFPRPAISLLLWLPYEEMMARVEAKNEPFPDPPRIRRMRWRAYDLLAENDAVTVIDVSGDIETNRKTILQAVLDKTGL